MTADTYRGALDAVERVLNRGGDVDDVLRAVVSVLHDRVPHFTWVGVAFMEEGELQLGPEAGGGEGEELSTPVTFEGAAVAELLVRRNVPEDDEAFLERVATLISPYCLVGWDTQGVPWSDVS